VLKGGGDVVDVKRCYDAVRRLAHDNIIIDRLKAAEAA